MDSWIWKGVDDMPDDPAVPAVPAVPDVPDVPDLPDVPEIPFSDSFLTLYVTVSPLLFITKNTPVVSPVYNGSREIGILAIFMFNYKY
jgi:hypothetical protein